ncbi:MAG: (S)-2-haloacid dehalogenase 4A [Alphaproteobacteria bacterium MarineAlpha9_Bin4]|nr:MAG: (S)-2-haloacid dehalogenase 4A [Alphaproteobacteria bacterium MarineAlpha9_Bin4]|tara:strand:+ start:677 stop:1378 length:702 start_codon:yes stop_codon:yes gene_type:complete
MKALFFDIFGTLVDWRTSLISEIKKNKIIKENDLYIEKFVINWRLEYQPILNEVNKKKIPWMLLDELHFISLNHVLKKMKINHLSENQKRELIYCWHKLRPWSDSVNGLISLNEKFITSSLSNGSIALQKNLVKHANLKFNFLISAENFKKYKPDLSVYLRAATTLGFKPQECGLVASHKNDLLAASKVGFNTIFIKREKEYGNFFYKFPKTSYEPNISISSLDNLIDIIFKK